MVTYRRHFERLRRSSSTQSIDWWNVAVGTRKFPISEVIRRVSDVSQSFNLCKILSSFFLFYLYLYLYNMKRSRPEIIYLFFQLFWWGAFKLGNFLRTDSTSVACDVLPMLVQCFDQEFLSSMIFHDRLLAFSWDDDNFNLWWRWGGIRKENRADRGNILVLSLAKSFILYINYISLWFCQYGSHIVSNRLCLVSQHPTIWLQWLNQLELRITCKWRSWSIIALKKWFQTQPACLHAQSLDVCSLTIWCQYCYPNWHAWRGSRN